MIHKAKIMNGEAQVGDFYANDSDGLYTAIMDDKDSQPQVHEWWKQEGLHGTPVIVGLAKREGKQCYLIHVK